MERKLKKKRYFWSVNPLWALCETWLLGILVILPLSLVTNDLPPAVFDNGILSLCALCGIWSVLRISIPDMKLSHQIAWEGAVAVGLSLFMTLVLPLTTTLLGWHEVWVQSNLGVHKITLLMLTGPGYFFARIGVRVWLIWDHERKKRMLFSLTHAHLSLVLLVIAVFVIFIAVTAMISTGIGKSEPVANGIIPAIVDKIFRTLAPLIAIWGIMMLLAILVMLPPSALVSYFIARKTTSRLEALASATQAMREGRYGVVVDVTGEDELAQLHDDFNAMTVTLNTTFQDLEEQRDKVNALLQSRRNLIANVSHELRTPITTIRAVLDAQMNREQDKMSADLRHDLVVIQGEILRLQRLIDDLFTLSRVELKHLDIDCQSLSASEIIVYAVDVMTPLAQQSGYVEVTARLPEHLPPVFADEIRLKQILFNLLRNSIQHTPPGGIVIVMASQKEKSVCIEVCDTGEGIAAEDLPFIWERFYQGKSTLQNEQGVGLGLALVKGLAEAMNGHIEVESQLGQGSCFRLELPRAD